MTRTASSFLVLERTSVVLVVVEIAEVLHLELAIAPDIAAGWVEELPVASVV